MGTATSSCCGSTPEAGGEDTATPLHLPFLAARDADENIKAGDSVIVWHTGEITGYDPACIDAYRIEKYER